MTNTLGLAGSMTSVATSPTQLWMVCNQWAWLCANKTVMKTYSTANLGE